MEAFTSLFNKMNPKSYAMKEELEKRDEASSKPSYRIQQAHFTFKDVESFNSDQNLEAWIRTFEKNAQICCRDDRHIYALRKRLLTGAGKARVDSSQGLMSF